MTRRHDVTHATAGGAARKRRRGSPARPLVRLALAAVVAVLAALGPQSAKAEESAKIDVRVIHATPGKAHIDPKLKDISKHFKRFAGFQRFDLVKRESMSLGMKETGTATMPNGKKLKLTYRGTSKKYVKLRLILGDLQMNIRVYQGGVFFHGGSRYKGGSLIVAVKAGSG